MFTVVYLWVEGCKQGGVAVCVCVKPLLASVYVAHSGCLEGALLPASFRQIAGHCGAEAAFLCVRANGFFSQVNNGGRNSLTEACEDIHIYLYIEDNVHFKIRKSCGNRETWDRRI